ncbi:MAG: hypothetical protein FWE67_14435, partial [Planctomycetaceae bacterium]|nr:hypothetical protein [Planctomycetaceae bacterium]
NRSIIIAVLAVCLLIIGIFIARSLERHNDKNDDTPEKPATEQNINVDELKEPETEQNIEAAKESD